jgi:murein DD-endopeptidase MepM/ murein hydrolase activator NlpD
MKLSIRFGTRSPTSLLRFFFAIFIATFLCGAHFAAEPSILILVDGPVLKLNYTLTKTNGAFAILHSLTLSELLSSGGIVASGDAANGLTGSIELSKQGIDSSGFYVLIEYPEAIATDFESAISDDAADLAENFIYYAPDLPEPLLASSPMIFNIFITDGYFNSQTVDGKLELSLIDSQGIPVSIPYSLNPRNINVHQGFAPINVTIGANLELTNVFLAATFISASQIQSAPPVEHIQTFHSLSLNPSRKKISRIKKSKLKIMLQRYQSSESIWKHPLKKQVGWAGTFGEWRKRDNGIDLHYGIDMPAEVGAVVYASKSGIVSHTGLVKSDRDALGAYLIVWHGDGTASRYVHVDPFTPVPLSDISDKLIVKAGDPIAKVADIDEAGPHLHFEILDGLPQEYDETIGQSLVKTAHPADTSRFVFDPPLISGSADSPPGFDRADPEIRWVGFNKTSPAQTPVLSLTFPYKYVVLQVLDEEGGYKLTPASVTFLADPAGLSPSVPLQLLFNTGSSIQGFFSSVKPGYAHEAQNAPRENRYRIWFPWDTQIYKSKPTGPRGFQVEAVDAAHHSNEPFHPVFGPEFITHPVSLAMPSVGSKSFPFKVKASFGPLPNEAEADVLDRFTFELVASPDTDWKAELDPPLSGNDDPRTTVLAHGENKNIQVKLSSLKANPGKGTLNLIARSTAFPGIAHSIETAIEPTTLVVNIRPPQDSNGIYRFSMQLGNDAPLAGEAGPRYRLKLTSGFWCQNQVNGEIDQIDPSVLLTNPLTISNQSDAFFDFSLDVTNLTSSHKVEVLDRTGVALLAEMVIPSVFVFDDYANNANFAIQIDGKSYGTFEQKGSTGKIIDISSWKLGEAHTVQLNLLFATGFRGAVICTWVPPWIKITKVKSFRDDGTIVENPTCCASGCLDFQTVGQDNLRSTNGIIEYTFSGP